MFSLANIKRHLNDQGGFSLAEVVMAVFLFTSAVVGVSGLVLSGGSAITRGASDATAANLANKKIEQVKSLPFYRSWAGKNQDIDDFYFNTTKDNSQQINNPGKVEDYDKITGASGYKMTTAVQYQVAAADESSMVPAVMASRALGSASDWVPKPATGNLLTTQIDKPTRVVNEAVHSLIVEVAVYYRVNGVEVVYKQRALCGDMLVPGGSSVPVLTVTAISPTSAAKTETNLLMKVTVNAQDTIVGGNFEVKLWASGLSDIVGTGTTVVNQSEIDTRFNLTGTAVKQGLYSISVYWQDNGWQDKNFRNCFTVLGTVPAITSIGDYKWGFRDMSARSVTINGTNLDNPSYVGLLGPNEGGTGDPKTDPDSVSIPGSIVSASSTKIVVNLNLGKVPDDSLTTKWTFVVTTGGGTARSGSSDRMLVDPKPQVTSITCTPVTFYRKCNYQNPIVVTGKYFQPGTTPTITLKKANCADVTGAYATGGAVTEDNKSLGTSHFTMSLLDLRLADNTVTTRPIKPGKGNDEVGNWNLYVTNADGLGSAETDKLVAVAHAPIQVSYVGNKDASYICYNDWDRRFYLSGNYFSPGYMKVSFYDQYGVSGDFTITGEYGAGQWLGQADTDTLVMNTIGLSNTTYSGAQALKVEDTENGQSCTFNLTVTEPLPNDVSVLAPGVTAPPGCTWPQQNAFWNDSTVPGHDTDASVADSNLCYDFGAYTYKIIAKRMRNSGVRWSFKPGADPEQTYPVTVSLDRANQYVLGTTETGVVTWSNFAPEITLVDVACSNGGSFWGPVAGSRIRIKKHI